ncbi:hypothetical protein H0H81_012770 [Sphagnurus paluster]|uniref:F-box domain-containing protein n=1 Tax=Sphagnurus paluster TaxID=117069 RepID=A0A9P7KJ06_9AGAR|nr:hypothetical protein H0H81_012770 [Sphagnurus paluster]
MTIAALPPELLDHTIDHLHDDMPTLRHCALVYRAWLAPSPRTHLPHHLAPAAQAPPASPPPHQISNRLRPLQSPDAPHLTQYIRELHIYEGISWQAWITHEPALVALLAQLKHVRRLHLQRSAALPIPWATLPSGLQRALGSPKLQELSIGTMAFGGPDEFLFFLEGCRSLRVLQLDHLLIGVPVAANDVEPTAHLDALVLGPRTSSYIVSCLLLPRSAMDVTGLRKLSVSISSQFGEFAELFRCVVSLGELEIVFMSDIDLIAFELLGPTDRFDMSHNPQLRTLQI